MLVFATKKSILLDLENYKIYATQARESNGVLRFLIDYCLGKLHTINFIFCAAVRSIYNHEFELDWNSPSIHKLYTGYIY